MSNLVGQEVGNYQLLRLLDYDGSASVYFGQHKQDQSLVAVKTLNSQTANRRIERWYTETQTLLALKHPHIVHMRDFGTQDNMQLLVTDWATQGTLLDLFTRSMPVSMVAIYVKQIACGLQYLHTRHIVHRDIKPTNILIGQDQNALLADFELAGDYRHCQSRAGTAAYAAPEQREGRPCPASDQYALGVLIYQWLYGQLPFHGSSSEIASQHRNTSPLQDKLPMFPYAIDQVLSTALAKDPDSRFANIQLFAEALEQACRSAAYWTPAQTVLVCRSSKPL